MTREWIARVFEEGARGGFWGVLWGSFFLLRHEYFGRPNLNWGLVFSTALATITLIALAVLVRHLRWERRHGDRNAQ